MSGDWVFLTCLWIVSVLLAAAGAWPVSDQRLQRWSDRFSVALTDEVASWARARLRRARAIRALAFVAGVNVSLLPMYMNVIDPNRAAHFSNPLTASSFFVAPALGALLAELLVVQRPMGARSAVLDRRNAVDYVDRSWTFVIGACGAVSLVAAITTATRHVPESSYVWVGAVTAGIALATITFGVNRIVDRPAVSPDGSLRAIDEALRADGAHHIAGASVALAVTGAVSALLIATSDGWWQLPIGMLNLLAIGCWRELAIGERWNVSAARQATA